jgi:hypothetical protein
MAFSLEIVKKHPVATGAIVLVGAALLYFMLKRSSSGGTQAGGLQGNDAQLQAIQSAENLTNAQYGSQVEIAQIQGQVASAQTAAQLAAVQAEAQSAENIVTTQTQGATDIATINANATTEQINSTNNARVSIAHDYFNTALEANQANVDAETAIAQHNFDIANQVVTQAGKDKGRSSTGWAQIISALEGRGPEAIAANQPSAVASSPAGILSASGGILKSIFSLF